MGTQRTIEGIWDRPANVSIGGPIFFIDTLSALACYFWKVLSVTSRNIMSRLVLIWCTGNGAVLLSARHTTLRTLAMTPPEVDNCWWLGKLVGLSYLNRYSALWKGRNGRAGQTKRTEHLSVSSFPWCAVAYFMYGFRCRHIEVLTLSSCIFNN